MRIRLYTDGACSNNPGIGGWAYLVSAKEKIIKRSGGEENTTNNRMELQAVVSGLSKLLEKWERVNRNNDFHTIEVLSDSAYVVNAVNLSWISKWKLKNWKTTSKENVKNIDLWKKLDELLKDYKKLNIEIIFTKVKGHSGNTFNEMCDEMAKNEIIKLKGE